MNVRTSIGSLRAARLPALVAAMALAAGVAPGVAAAATVGDLTGPAALTNSTTADFAIPVAPSKSPNQTLTVLCARDGGAAVACAGATPGPWTMHYTGLREGPHQITVTADDDDSPSSRVYRWTVDTTPPVTALDSRPPVATGSSAAVFGFHSEPGATFTCTLDGASRLCASPASYTGLGQGLHTFSVAARDAAGNTDPSPPTWTWAVRRNLAPLPSFVIDPESPRVGETVTLTSTSTDPDSAIATQTWSVAGRGATLSAGNLSGRLRRARFTRVGRYRIRLTVTDALGAVATTTRTVRVRQLPAPPGSWLVQDAEEVDAFGARMRVLRVRADRGTKVEVRCRGRHCPRRLRRLRVTLGRRGVLRARRFERWFRAGAIIEVRVWDAVHLTKLVRIHLRANAAPVVRYGCEAPGRHRVGCSS